MTTNVMQENEWFTDAQLVELVLGGDRDSFGQIVARYQSAICALAYSACGNFARSEDLAQEIFITDGLVLPPGGVDTAGSRDLGIVR